MKLGKRLHNISLHLHTVIGIILCTILFIIFFCGSFALFKNETALWEFEIDEGAELPAGISIINEAYKTFESDSSFFGSELLFYDLSKKSGLKIATYDRDGHFKERLTYGYQINKGNAYSLNDLLYELHFLEPIPIVGIYIAGLICVFLVLALITGTLIHLKNFFYNFFLIRKEKRETIFLKDAHVVLGVITLPFQLVYAITGAIFCLLLILIIPQVLVTFKGDTSVMESYFEEPKPTRELKGEFVEFNDLEQVIARFETDYDVTLEYMRFYHVGDKHMQFFLSGITEEINSEKYIIYDCKSEKVVLEQTNEDKNLYLTVSAWVSALHFANFGGISLRIIFFVLSIVSSLVFYSGGILWLRTRKKKKPQLEFYFNGLIWGLVVATFSIFLLRYFIDNVVFIFYGIWLVWAILAFFINPSRFVSFSKWVSLVLASLFVILSFIKNGISLPDLLLPSMLMLSSVFLLLFKHSDTRKKNLDNSKSNVSKNVEE